MELSEDAKTSIPILLSIIAVVSTGYCSRWHIANCYLLLQASQVGNEAVDALETAKEPPRLCSRTCRPVGVLV